MAAITAANIKELRGRTGVGMMDCKKALQENDGDMEQAVDWLREKGLAKADKKSDRIAAEGLVGVHADGTKASVAEVNSETDFVPKNPDFQAMVKVVTELALEKDGDADAVKAAAYPGGSVSVEEHIKEMVGAIGENMSFRRSSVLSVKEGVVATYIHNAATDGLGKIGVLVALESSGDTAKLEEFGKKIAMHIAAINPLAMTRDELDPEIVEKEKAIFTEQAIASGKPANIAEKMVEGRIRKFYEEVCLMAQEFVLSEDKDTVEKAIELAAKEIGAPVKMTGYVRMELGEGIEKKEDDFASEVASMASGS